MSNEKLHFSPPPHSWITRTDPADVARVESRTVISTPQRRDTVPTTAEGVAGKLGQWMSRMSPPDMENSLNERFPGCMKGEFNFSSN